MRPDHHLLEALCALPNLRLLNLTVGACMAEMDEEEELDEALVPPPIADSFFATLLPAMPRLK